MSTSLTVWVQAMKGRNSLLQWICPITGRRKSKSAETADPEKAEKARARLEVQLQDGRYQEASRLTWEAFRQTFEEEYLPGLRPRSQEKLRTVLDTFETIVNPARLRLIDERLLSLFVKGMRERKMRGGKVGMAPWSMRNYLVALRGVLSWAVDQKMLPSVPKFPTVLVPHKKPQPIAAESVEKLLAKAPDEQWRTFMLCGWWGGMRLSEVADLRWDASDEHPWIDWEMNKIVLPAAASKNKQDQSIPIHPVLRQALASLPRDDKVVFPLRSRSGGRISRSGITNRILRMAKQAGVRLGMHKLRKGFGCRVAMQLGKGAAPVLHELMRHSNMGVTMQFYASVDGVLQESMASLK